VNDRPDVLLLSLGTTLGWRVADALFADQLRNAGVGVAVEAVRIGATGRLRRAYPVTDLVEATAARRALASAIDRHQPRALAISTTTAAMLAGARLAGRASCSPGAARPRPHCPPAPLRTSCCRRR
jgi:hypothetical protein